MGNNNSNHSTNAQGSFKKLLDLWDTFITAIYIWWDDNIVKPFRRARFTDNLTRFFQHRDITHHFDTGRGWIITLVIIFLVKKFFPEEVDSLPGIAWAFDFMTGILDMVFTISREVFRWIFGMGDRPTWEWIVGLFKALL